MAVNQGLRLVSILGAFLVGFWLPLRLIGYVPSLGVEVAFDLLISGISIINLYLSYSDQTFQPKIPRSWLQPGVLMDLVCVLPLSLYAFMLLDAKVEWLLLLNFLAIRHIRQIKSFLDFFPELSPMTYRLVPLVMVLPLLVHLIACGWIALGSGTIGPDADKALEYVRGVYWAFTTLTTVGYGDIAAKTISQMLYACMTQVVGVGVFGFILSNVASLLSRSDAAREHHMDNLDKIETFMRTHQTPTILKTKIRSYYHYLWNSKKGYQDRSLLDGLPAKIQSELYFHINRSIVEKVSFLRGANVDLIEDLMHELDPRIFVPGERIFKVDEAGDALYFIQNGQVDIVTAQNQKIVTLSDGSCFGEMALISDQPRSATARAATYCDIYRLSKEAFQKVAIAYPEFKRQIDEMAEQRKVS